MPATNKTLFISNAFNCTKSSQSYEKIADTPLWTKIFSNFEENFGVVSNHPLRKTDKIMKFEQEKQIIESAWENRDLLSDNATKEAIRRVVEAVDKGELRTAEPVDLEKSEWQVNEWVKKAIILYFPIQTMRTMRAGCRQDPGAAPRRCSRHRKAY